MKQQLIDLFNSYPDYAFLCSIAINILVAVAGVLPSVFLTAANILFFGFWKGATVSFAGEAIGAVIAFWLYRKGFKKNIQSKSTNYPLVQKLLQSEGKEAFIAIISLRLIPFVPSGIITFTAAIGRVSLLTFFIASSLGKIPALLFESYAAYQVTAFNWQGKVILLLAGLYLLYLAFRSKKRS
ncbi:MAG: VTT domain-containing protein [Bacteroidota bacterium]|nr:VTT domain-containing protein [Bacteroidota bacterium]